MEIKNKIESYNKIIELELNRFPEKVFKAAEKDEVAKFLKDNPVRYYAIRDKSKAGGVFKLKVEAENVLNEISDYTLFSINVSSYNYVENQLLVGEILITDNIVSAVLSKNKEFSVRDALKYPDFNFISSIFDNNLLDEIPCFDNVYKYIIEHKLRNVIVEFAYFDTPLGVNKENIIVYELRTDY